MQRAIRHAPAGQWPASEARGSVTLAFDDRHRRRIRLAADCGPVLLDLPKAVAMADGDGLQTEDGGWIAVRAAAEPLIAVTCPTPHALLRIAWHLGNRHLPAEIRPDRILIRPDHVIVAMLHGLGAATAEIVAPFQPEGGAYDDQRHGHSHGHGDSHSHSHSESHSHSHDHGDGDGHHHHHHDHTHHDHDHGHDHTH